MCRDLLAGVSPLTLDGCQREPQVGGEHVGARDQPGVPEQCDQGRVELQVGVRRDHGVLAACRRGVRLERSGRGGEVGPTHPGAQDLSFCPLDETRAIVAPCAWDQAGRATVAALGPEPLVIDEDEAFTFCANSVVVGDVVVMPAGVPARVARRLEAWGFWVQTVDVSELHKGGGSIRCMTLPLDTVLDDARLTRPAPSDMEPVPA